MKKLISVFMSLIMILTMCNINIFANKIIAYPVEGGNLYLDATTGVIKDVDISITNAVIPDTIQKISVKKIGSFAFYECKNLKSVVISQGITEIENDAFGYCTALNSIKLSDSIKSIGENAFYNCTSLSEIVIPKNVTNISKGAFSNCLNLNSISVDDGNTYFSSESGILFSKDKTKIITYPAGKSGIEYTISDNVTEIGENAFYGCKKLNNIKISDSVTTIGSGAFSNCFGLISIVIPDSVINMGNQVFYECTNITSVVLSNSITKIGSQSFHGCKNLVSITIPDSVTVIDNTAFQSCLGLTSIIIPENVTTIGNHAFYGCSNLKTITIPKSVITVGIDMFSNCNNLAVVYCCKGSLADNKSLYPGNVNIQYGDSKININWESYLASINNYETAIKAVETVINNNVITDDLKYDLENFIDEAIGLSVTVSIPTDNIINKAFINELSSKAIATKQAIDNILANKNINLTRDLLTSITIKANNQVQISSDLDTLNVNNLHIDISDSGARITLGKGFIEDNVESEPLILSFVIDNSEIKTDLNGQEIAVVGGTRGKFSTNYKLNTPIILSLPLLANTDITYQGVKGPDGYAVSIPNASTNKIQFRATQSGTYTVTNVTTVSFTDLTALSQVQRDTLRRLYAHGLISGKSETVFEPTSTLTRAEFTTMLLKTIGKYDATYKGISGFVDMNNHWASPMVAMAKKLGIIAGYDSDNTFRPDNKINNEQLYHILGTTYTGVNSRANVSGAYISSMINNFTDGSIISQWAREKVAVSVNANIYTGNQGKKFNPKNEVTRLNAAIAIGKLFEISPFEGDWR